MSEQLTIQSHRGPYTVRFDNDALEIFSNNIPERTHIILDRNVGDLYQKELEAVLRHPSLLSIEATEGAKSLEAFPHYVEHLLSQRVRRGDTLVAIGGGITQDITAFLAATLLRGLDWEFYPTTLLAQADSCIGSKSSINVGKAKNILGTYTPPKKITVTHKVLKTLQPHDVRSGVGEILKVHAIDGPSSFDRVAEDYEKLLSNVELMEKYVLQSLKIKKDLIEMDEFDRGPRNVMNYGHSFGHALEAATDFAIPHGIAVTIGMDMANYLSLKMSRLGQAHHDRMHPVLIKNFSDFQKTKVPMENFLSALAKDKKNVGTSFGLILMNERCIPESTKISNDDVFQDICYDYLTKLSL